MTHTKSTWWRVFLVLWPIAAFGATVCDPTHFPGPYGFQLSGQTTISGTSKPVASLGRILFAPDGTVSGYSSVMFDGYLLGNPVTGKYETQGDCTVTWSLQDDSGGYQHFTGAIGADAKSVRFRQTDPGSARSGVMSRTADRCSVANLEKEYEFTLSGSSVPMSTGQVPDTVNVKGLIQSDGAGAFKLVTPGASAIDVTVHVEDDCIVNLAVALPSGPVALRGILVNDGKDILAIRTDPGWMAPAKLAARQK